jgi:4-alpha-glucanotransferase
LAELQRLARLYHILPSYKDINKAEVVASAESLMAALRGLGVAIRDPAQAPAAIEQRLHEVWERGIEPVLVAWEGRLPELPLRLRRDDAGEAVVVQFEYEDGNREARVVDASQAPVTDRRAFGRDEYVTVALPVNMTLPFGYHGLRLRAGGRETRSLVISAPRRAYAGPVGKRWGLFLPLYSLHSRDSWGIGDFGDLEKLTKWAGEAGAHFVGTLPLLSTFLENPYEPSPYVPVSRLHWNEIFINLRPAATVSQGGLAQDVAVPAATQEEARRLNAREPVPHKETMALKRRVLEKLTRLSLQGPAANEARRTFVAARPALQDYAAFRAALEHLGPSWRVWPEQQRRGNLSGFDYDPETADYFAFAQEQARRQIEALSAAAREHEVLLYLDLPVGVHPDGYDAWRYQDLFVDGIRVGAPPDLLARDGQNWGFAPLDPERLRESGYEYMRAYLSHHLSVAGILRIDHAIGLHRLFWIPAGGTGRDGVFVQQPAEEMYAILALESHRHEAVLVGEDLGLVPPVVEEGLREHGIRRMYVQLFQMTGDPEAPLGEPEHDQMASFGTHDLPPFAAFWEDADLEERRRLGLMDEGMVARIRDERTRARDALLAYLRQRGLIQTDAASRAVYRALTRLLAESDADWVVLNLEDAWGEMRPQNLPGTNGEQHENWNRRARYSLEEMAELSDITLLFEIMRRARPEAERSFAAAGKDRRREGDG